MRVGWIVKLLRDRLTYFQIYVIISIRVRHFIKGSPCVVVLRLLSHDGCGFQGSRVNVAADLDFLPFSLNAGVVRGRQKTNRVRVDIIDGEEKNLLVGLFLGTSPDDQMLVQNLGNERTSTEKLALLAPIFFQRRFGGDRPTCHPRFVETFFF